MTPDDDVEIRLHFVQDDPAPRGLQPGRSHDGDRRGSPRLQGRAGRVLSVSGAAATETVAAATEGDAMARRNGAERDGLDQAPALGRSTRGFGALLLGVTFALAFSAGRLGTDVTLTAVGVSPPPFRSDIAIFSYGNLAELLLLIPTVLFLLLGYDALFRRGHFRRAVPDKEDERLPKRWFKLLLRTGLAGAVAFLVVLFSPGRTSHMALEVFEEAAMAVWIALHAVLVVACILFLAAVLRPLLPDQTRTLLQWATWCSVSVVAVSAAAMTVVFVQTWPMMIYTNFYDIPFTPWTSLPVSITVTAMLFFLYVGFARGMVPIGSCRSKPLSAAIAVWIGVSATAMALAILRPEVWWLGITAIVGGGFPISLAAVW